jgi:hypothetical protein
MSVINAVLRSLENFEPGIKESEKAENPYM